MKTIKEIPLGQIIIDRLPLNKEGLGTALAVYNGVPMPPIKVVAWWRGRYKIKDGRHRILANKLNGKKTIMAIISPMGW